ncbi:MAG: GNAT family N-acetyltransferase [Propioniciclava sp.]|uniref:GNAT family N-acetyltransferase n=1 Tax=Propioniciclava sp. TaxID=2038686 RepID=UPI0039E3D66B
MSEVTRADDVTDANASGIQVREVDAAWAEHACAIMHAAFAEYGATGKPSGAMLETPATLRDELKDGVRLAMAWRDEVAVAMVKFVRAEDDTFYFSRLAVLPEQRNTGITRAVIDWLTARAQDEDAAGISCCVRAEEADLIGMYSHFGMSITGHTDKPSLTGRVIPVTWLAMPLSRA